MSAFNWRQFAGEVILWAVRWYCRYGTRADAGEKLAASSQKTNSFQYDNKNRITCLLGRNLSLPATFLKT